MSWHSFEKMLDYSSTFVLATASATAKPQCATILFAYQDGLFYFYTFNDSRKYSNLKENPNVSVVIHNDHGYAQLDGSAKELFGSEAASARLLIIKRKQSQSGYDDDPRCRYFLITPTWIRIMTENSYPPKYEILVPSTHRYP